MKTSKIMSVLLVLALTLTLAMSVSTPVLAADDGTAAAVTEAADNGTGAKAVAAAIVVGLVATAGAIGMAIAIGKSTESMARQPEAAGKINSAMMLGLVFIETAIIYALIVAILIIFVL